MTETPWPKEVADFYRDLSLGEGPLDRIAELHDAGLQVRRWKRIACGLAVACALLVTVGAVLLTGGTPGTPPDAPDTNPPRLADNTQKNPPAVPVKPPAYDLIAVRLHRDWCGKCKQMGNVFAEIQHDLESRKILFVTYDLTDDVTTKQSLLLGKILEIRAPLEELESGNIAILTPDGTLLELLDGTSGRQNLATKIAMRL